LSDSAVRGRGPRTQVGLLIRFVLCVVVAMSSWPLASVAQAATTISFVQGNAADPQSPQPSVTILFTTAQAAGDLNVVAVGWNDSAATVTTVTDTRGNPYALAVAATVISGVESQAIYYAKNIAAAAANAGPSSWASARHGRWR